MRRRESLPDEIMRSSGWWRFRQKGILFPAILLLQVLLSACRQCRPASISTKLAPSTFEIAVQQIADWFESVDVIADDLESRSDRHR